MGTYDTALERDKCYVWSVFKLGPPQVIQVEWSRSTAVCSVVNARTHDGENHLNSQHSCLGINVHYIPGNAVYY